MIIAGCGVYRDKGDDFAAYLHKNRIDPIAQVLIERCITKRKNWCFHGEAPVFPALSIIYQRVFVLSKGIPCLSFRLLGITVLGWECI